MKNGNKSLFHTEYRKNCGKSRMSYEIRIDSEKAGDTPDIRFRILIGLKGLPHTGLKIPKAAVFQFPIDKGRTV